MKFSLLRIALAITLLGTAHGEERPNIVLILLDDLGFADVGFNAETFGVETDIQTPNIDAVAKEGAIFKQAYVPHPFCGPSRMGILSGRMPHCFGGQRNLPNQSLNLRDYNERGIPQSETLISTVLKDSGYTTGCIGKWHLGYAPPFHPNTRGFDEFFGFLGGGHQYYPSLSDKVEPKVNDYQYFLERNGVDIRSPEGAYLTDMLSDDAVRFIETHHSSPFFLYLAYNAPHSPLQGKLEDLKHLYPDHAPTGSNNGISYRDYGDRQNYVAMVYAVDRGVGQIVEAIAENAITEETLIIFLSDNGGKILQAGNNAPLQDDKGSTLEGGIRTPMFMTLPGTIPAQVLDHPVLALDLYPTFTALAEASVPQEKILDGVNLWESTLSATPPPRTAPLFWLRHHGVGNEIAIREGDFKAYRKNFAFWKLFNIAIDPSEENDLAQTHEETLNALIQKGAEWSTSHQPPLWHDTSNSAAAWEENAMPKYEESFRRR